MTVITLFRQGAHIVGFSAKGHTGFADAGEDVLCSAISAITQTAVIGIVEVLQLEAAIDISDAELYCMLEKSVSGSDLDKAELIYSTMAAGLRSIANSYDDYIKIIEREV